jgi:hypothetical protein
MVLSTVPDLPPGWKSLNTQRNFVSEYDIVISHSKACHVKSIFMYVPTLIKTYVTPGRYLKCKIVKNVQLEIRVLQTDGYPTPDPTRSMGSGINFRVRFGFGYKRNLPVRVRYDLVPGITRQLATTRTVVVLKTFKMLFV